jgi:siroheme decarboxylase
MLTPRDRAILKAVQREFPLVVHPYDVLARETGLPADEVRRRLAALRKRGVVRRIVPMLDRARLGLRGVLVAACVDSKALARVTKVLAARPEVTHNYLRGGPVNLWFTATLRRGECVEPLVGEVLAAGARTVFVLPTQRVFKLDASFDVGPRDRQASPAPAIERKPRRIARVAPADQRLLAELRADFPASAEPWAEAAKRLGMTEARVLRRLAALQRSGILRSVRAALDQRRLGLAGNVLVAWHVPPARVESVGRMFARRPEASHVVQRGAAVGWPYNFYTMIHAPTLAVARAAVRKMATASRVSDYVELVTRRELKKSAPRYF